MKTKEELFSEAFDAWADSKKKLILAEAAFEKVSYPIRRDPKANLLMGDVFGNMTDDIKLLEERESTLHQKMREIKKTLSQTTSGDQAC